MKTLLRSCFVSDPKDDEVLFRQNYQALIESRLGFDTIEDSVIWNFIQDFYRGHGHLPSIQTIRGHFQGVNELEVVDRIEILGSLPAKTRGDFLLHLENVSNDRRTRQVIDIAKEMTIIAQKGLIVKDERGKERKLQGAIEAVRYALDKSHSIVSPTLGAKLSGSVLQDGQEFLERYKQVKADPRYGIGQYMGIQQVDNAIRGAKKHELWIHAAFTGGLKSSLSLQWAYNQAIYYGFSSLYFSLEMPYVQCMNILYTMHSAHEDFQEVRESLGIRGLGLDYVKVRDGELEPNEERFLFDYVVPDFNKTATVPHSGPRSLQPSQYGDIFIEVCDPDKNDFTIIDLRNRAELIYSKTPFAMIFVDHIGLMGSRGRHGTTTEKLNEVVRDLKKLAMSFNRGTGIAVVGLSQISRDGFRLAEKNGGRYNLTSLSYANELERSADVVTATYVDDELRAMNRAIISCLKSRDQAPFDRAPLRVEFNQRRILTDLTSLAEVEARRDTAKGNPRHLSDAPVVNLDDV